MLEWIFFLVPYVIVCVGGGITGMQIQFWLYALDLLPNWLSKPDIGVVLGGVIAGYLYSLSGSPKQPENSAFALCVRDARTLEQAAACDAHKLPPR